MTLGAEDQEALAALEFRIRTVLPEEYQDCYEDVLPVSMGSAGLKYGADGKVAWNEMWATFCDEPTTRRLDSAQASGRAAWMWRTGSSANSGPARSG